MVAQAAPYTYGTYHFSTPPRRVVGVKYRAGDAASAVPLGGLGTGTVYLDSRGRLAGPSIANTYRPAGGVMPGCGFAVRAGAVEQPLAELATSYLGHFPMVDLQGHAPSFPLHVQLRAMSPFVLGDAESSAIPAAMFTFTLTNGSKRAVEGGVTFRWTPPVAGGSGGARAQGNVGGFLTWRLGDLAAGKNVVLPVTLAAGRSLAEVKQRLAKPAGDLALDDDGAFNWEDTAAAADDGGRRLPEPAGLLAALR